MKAGNLKECGPHFCFCSKLTAVDMEDGAALLKSFFCHLLEVETLHTNDVDEVKRFNT